MTIIDYTVFLQDVSADFNLSTIISLFVGIAAIGGAIYKGLTWYSGQNEKRALVIKAALEEQAKVVKDASENKAKEILETSEVNARQIEKALDDRARDVKKDLESTTQQLKEKILGIEQIISALTDTVKENFTELKGNFAELAKRADLTNGNVAQIRNDMSDLGADIQELFERVDPDIDSKDSQKVSREKDNRRRERKRQIEADRLAQVHPGEPKYGR